MGLITVVKRNTQEARVGYAVQQPSHNLKVGMPVKLNGEIWVPSCADSRSNADTIGVVAEVYDLNSFRLVTEGLIVGNYIPGENYYLSPITPGALVTLPDPELWAVGQVRQFIGTGVKEGLMVDVSLGEEIMDFFVEDKYVTGVSFDVNRRKLIIRQNGVARDLEVTIPQDIQLQSDWKQTDTAAKDYIKNKPQIAKVGLSGAFRDLEGKPDLVKNLTDLLDCPDSLQGKGGYFLRIKPDCSGIEFIAP